MRDDQSGDGLEFDSVFAGHVGLLGQVAVGMGLSRDEGHDVLQDVFVEFLDGSPQFDNVEHARRWLVRVTVNRCILEFRRKRSRDRKVREFLLRRSQEGVVSAGPEQVTIAAEEREAVREGMDRMDERLRVPLVLKYFCGMNATEIGNLLDAKAGTVRKRLSEGRILLAKALLEMGVGP